MKPTHEEFLKKLLENERAYLQRIETEFEKANIEYAVKTDMTSARIHELEEQLKD